MSNTGTDADVDEDIFQKKNQTRLESSICACRKCLQRKNSEPRLIGWLGYSRNASTSTKATGGIGVNGDWDVLFPIRFALSKSTIDNSDSGLLAIDLARVAQHIEKDEEEEVEKEDK